MNCPDLAVPNIDKNEDGDLVDRATNTNACRGDTVVLQIEWEDGDIPDSDQVDYQWTIAEAPDAFDEDEFEGTDVSPHVELEFDGDYEFELTVLDADNDEVCQSQDYRVEVSVSPDVVLKLEWDPDGPDPEIGDGTDLEFYYFPEEYSWDDGDAPVVGPASTSQDWGSQGCGELEINNMYGMAPSYISHYSMGASWHGEIHVHYNEDHRGSGQTDSEATVEITIGDETTVEEHTLEQESATWHVGDLIKDDTDDTPNFEPNDTTDF